MKISIVIPAYNEEHYIGKCLESIRKLEMKPYEVIIVDNGSTDKTSEIALSHGARVITETKKGITFARNKGFDEAKGDIIARTDADAIVPKDWLKNCVNAFNKNKNIVGVSGPTIFYDFPFFRTSSLPTKLYLFISSLLFRKKIMIGANMILTKKAWNNVKKEISLNDDEIHEDIDISIHLGKYGNVINDSGLVVYQSARRMLKNKSSFFVSYPKKYIKTYIQNRKSL